MTLAALLMDLQTAGAAIRAVDGRIGVQPRSLLTPERRTAIQHHRAALIAMFAAPEPRPGIAVPCHRCGHRQWWRLSDTSPERDGAASPTTGWTCGACHPPACPERVVWREGDAQ